MLTWSLACHGCDDDFDPASRVIDLRLLAVQADQPFARPGEEVQLRALFHDPEGRPLEWAFGPCAEADSSAALACLRALAFEDLTIGKQPSYVLRVPGDALGGGAGNAFLGVAVVACPGTLRAGDTHGIPVACEDAQGRALALDTFEVGMKRIFVRDDARNENPAIDMVLWDGEQWPQGELREARCDGEDGKCRKHALELRSEHAQETSTDEDGQTIREVAIVQFYATGGTFEDDVRTIEEPDTTWKPRKQDRGKELTLWFVLRDDRGGVSWTERRVRVR
jgi:hypothetical protein